MDDPILQIQDLRAEFVTPDGIVSAVNGVSLDLTPGKTLVLTGESGSGKTSIGLALLGLLPHPGRVTGGQVRFKGRDLMAMPPEDLRKIRGKEIAIVFQDASTGLNPVLNVGQQVEEIITNHLSIPRKEARRRSVEVLAEMGLPEPQEVAKRYPFQLSGGMAQRVMIAIATALKPEVLILDEPTSALDVTVQAAILEDLSQLQRQHNIAILLITHDLGVVAQMADDVAVMYAGYVVEQGDAQTLFHTPRHPYTWSLLASRPRWDREEDKRLAVIKGTPPSLIDLPEQCPFVPRCPKATTVCRIDPMPALTAIDTPQHVVACYNPIYQQELDEAAAS